MKLKMMLAMLAGSVALGPAFAEDDRTAIVEELLGLMDFQANIEKSFEMVKQMQLQQMERMGLSDAQSEKARESSQRVMDLISEEMSWENLKNDYIQLYSEVFSTEELSGLRDFYKSDVGQKFIEKQPELMQKSMELSQKQMMEIMPKIQAATREAAAESGGLKPPSLGLGTKEEVGVPAPPTSDLPASP